MSLPTEHDHPLDVQARTTGRGDDAPPPPSEDGERPVGRIRSWLADPLQAALIAIPIAIFALGAWTQRFLVEDAFIYFRVTDNIYEGAGPVFNAGERVEIFTSPLWTALLAVLRAPFGFLGMGHLSVYLGIVCSLGAVAFAVLAARRLNELLRGAREAGEGIDWPLGLILVAALPPMWHWATSGLETSLTFCWVAVSFWGLVNRMTADQHRLEPAWRPIWVPLVIGLGPLVRPDLGLVSAVLFLGLLLTSAGGWRSWVRAVGIAAAIPVAYEVFRMGYFASMVPNTALAKNASGTNWSRGWSYVGDFSAPYLLWLPVAALAVAVGIQVRRGLRHGWRVAALVVTPVVAALLMTTYVVRLGGDYLHGRFLVFPLFALALPAMTIRGPRHPLRARAHSGRTAPLAIGTALALVVVTWAAVTIIHRPPLPNTNEERRTFYLSYAGTENPLEMEDFPPLWISDGVAARSARDQGRDVLLFRSPVTDPGDKTEFATAPGSGTAVILCCVGMAGSAAGTDVWVVDQFSLGDPLGARLEDARKVGVGHEKMLPLSYIRARFVPPQPDDPVDVLNARRTLSCGRVRDLLAATNDPMTASRFIQNIFLAPSLTAMKVPADPALAELRYCD